MSLKVWLPLNGSLENIGISNVTVTNNDATIDNNGKIGKCYSFDGTDDYLEINYCIHEWSFSNQYSICFWIKPTDSTNRQIIGTTNYSWVILRDNNKLHFNQWDIGGNHTNTMNIDGGTLPIDTWAHCVITWNSRIIKLYINGAEVASATATTTATNKTTNENIKIGGNIYSWGKNSYFKGCLNDVRIYDHCLSAKEVKEISHGLVLHYKLDSPYVEPTINYLAGKSEDFVGKWSSYGFGSRGTLTDGAITPALSGQTVLVTNNATDTTNVATELATTFNSVQTSIMNKGESFTGSCYVKGNGATIGKRVHIHLYNTNGTNTLSTGKDYTLTNEWQRITYTLTWTYDNPSTNSGNCYVVGYISTGESFYVSNWQVEKKDHVTPYTSTDRETTNAVDSSGYENDGTIIGTISCSMDTTRYEITTYLPKATLITHSRPLGGGTNQEWTCAAWVKLDTTSTSNQYLNNFNKGNHIVYSSNNTPLLYLNNGDNDYYRYGSQKVNQGEWTHIAFVFKNSDATRNVYINGVLTNGSGPNKTSTPSGIPETITIGDRFAGYMSDYRIYATALSAEDILDLYHTSANIDNLGRVHGFEISEIAENKFFKVNLAINGDLDRASNGVGTYSQSNCTQTYENNSIRIYRPPNLVHDSSTMHNMWGGVRIRNSSVNSCHEYNSDTDNLFNLQKGHTYVIYFKVKGQSSNAATSIGWTNQMGWSGGGLNPAPSNVEYLYTPVNFNGEMDCFYKFTINDEIVKTCTSSYSYAVSGKQYLSYNDFMYGFGYENTGTLGTDVYVSNYRLYDITDIVHGNISLSGIINFLSFNEDDYDHAKISKYGEMQSLGFIEK